jgi:hypothetical protein
MKCARIGRAYSITVIPHGQCLPFLEDVEISEKKIRVDKLGTRRQAVGADDKNVCAHTNRRLARSEGADSSILAGAATAGSTPSYRLE